MRRPRYLAPLALIAVPLLAGASSSPGGCGSGTVESAQYVDYVDLSCPGPGCDMSHGEVPGSSPDCGNGPGQCPCSLGSSGYCGYCASAPADQVCRYCPPDSYCSEDPCSATCPTQEQPAAICPDDFPIDCGGSCCPSDYPACCANKDYCGEDALACQGIEDDSSSSGSYGCGWDCGSAGLSSAQFKEGCCSSDSCVASCSDTCGNGWYEAGGQMFGPCNVQDSGCMQNAAQGAVNYCY